MLCTGAALAALACTPAAPPSPPEPLVVRIGVPEAEIAASDVGLREIASLLSLEGLTTQTSEGRVRPRIADRWTVSSDGLTWRISLRPDVTFHDGTPATAPLVVESLRAAAARARQGWPGLIDILKIEAAGSSEIVVHLRRRSTFLLDDLDAPITRVLPDKSVVGTGAFRKVAEGKTEITFEAHDKYHQGRPQLDRVVVSAYSTLRTAWASLLRREIDVLWDLSRDAFEFAGASNVALYSYLRHYVLVVVLNSSRPKFASTTVRRALNAAVDREALIRDVLRGQGMAASNPIWPHHWAYDSTQKGYVYDPSLANTTLEAAGLELVTRPDGRRSRLAFTCIVPAKFATWERMALNVQKQLYDVGVDMQLEVIAADKFDSRVRGGDFDAVLIEMLSGPSLSRPFMFWRWGGEPTAYNMFGYRSAEADRWFDAVRSAASDAEYRIAASQLQRTLLADPPGLFLAWSRRTRAVTRRFNVPVEADRDPMPSLPTWTVNRGNGTTP